MKALLTLCLALLLGSPARAALVTLSLSPSQTQVASGEVFTVDVRGQYDGSGLLLGGAFDLVFHAGLLQLLDVTLLAPADVGGSTGTLQFAGDEGVIHGIGFASFDGVQGSFDLARIRFHAGAEGISPLLLRDAGDPVFLWANEGLEQVPLAALPGLVTIGDSAGTVPAPATGWLVGVALAALGCRRSIAPRSQKL